MHGSRAISAALSNWHGTLADFIRQLDEDGVSYLSYSKIASVEACEYRYLLEYVERVEQEEPAYFKKGRIFHEIATMAHRQLAEGGGDRQAIHRVISEHFHGDDQAHLMNATELLIDNRPRGYEVIATELPFVFSLGNRLPPIIGVIDLLLRRGQTFLVVDHKTGRSFCERDELQLHLYREHLRRAFKLKLCLACFDEYRWVNNLESIRKPAFRRTRVKVKPWQFSLLRISIAYGTIRRIQKTGHASSGGNCFACHLKDVCPKARLGNRW